MENGEQNSSPSLPLERKKITSSPFKGEDRGEGEGKGKFLSI